MAGPGISGTHVEALPDDARCSRRPQVERLHEKRRENRELAPLGRRSRISLPLVIDLQEAVQAALGCQSQLHLGTKRKYLVLPTDQDVGKAVDVVVSQLERRVVHETGAQASFQEIG